MYDRLLRESEGRRGEGIASAMVGVSASRGAAWLIPATRQETTTERYVGEECFNKLIPNYPPKALTLRALTDNGPDAMAGRRKLHSVRGREAFFVKTRPNRGCRKATEGR